MNERINLKDTYLTTANYRTEKTVQIPVTKDLNNEILEEWNTQNNYRENFYDKSSSFVAATRVDRNNDPEVFINTNILTMQQARDLARDFNWKAPITAMYPWRDDTGRISLYEKFPRETSRLG